MVTVIQERHIILDFEESDGHCDKKTTYNARYGHR